VVRVRRERRRGEKVQQETAHFVASPDRSRAAAEAPLALAREHWGEVENGLHHVRDTTLQADRCTVFRGHAPQNLAAFRNAALNWLRRLGADNLAAQIRRSTRDSQRSSESRASCSRRWLRGACALAGRGLRG
jgi:hypothetical protein